MSLTSCFLKLLFWLLRHHLCPSDYCFLGDFVDFSYTYSFKCFFCSPWSGLVHYLFFLGVYLYSLNDKPASQLHLQTTCYWIQIYISIQKSLLTSHKYFPLFLHTSQAIQTQHVILNWRCFHSLYEDIRFIAWLNSCLLIFSSWLLEYQVSRNNSVILNWHVYQK